MNSPLKKAALAYAAEGRKVFPCLPDSKTPATKHGFHDASCDLAQVEAWWTDNPLYNIAWQPQTEGLCCIDIDGSDGEEAYAELQIERGYLPDTLEITTPRGGRHLYFRGDLPPSQSKLAPHVDTRGGGSYALLPPSAHSGGEYRVTCESAPAKLPVWPGELLASLKKTKAVAEIEDLDLPCNVDRATAYLKAKVERGEAATEGAMGDKETFVVACNLLNFGLSDEMAFDLLSEHYNPHCNPPWEADDLRVKIDNAAAYAENDRGSWATSPASVSFADALSRLPPEDPTPEKAQKWLKVRDFLARPKPVWLLPDAIQEQSTVLLWGPPKSFKTYAALDMALVVASGVIGYGRPAQAGREVLYVAGEAPYDVAERADAWAKLHGFEDVPDTFSIHDGMPALVVRENARDDFIQSIIDMRVRPALIVLDTAARAMRGLNENDSKDAGAFVDVVDSLKRIFECAVLVIHHGGKDTDTGPRGSIVFTADFDTVHRVSREGTKQAPIICIQNTAQRTASEREEPWRFLGSHALGPLVFSPMDNGSYYAHKSEADPLAPKKIIAILSKFSSPVATNVLAHELVGQFEDGEAHDRAAEACGKLLVKRHELAGFRTGHGQGMTWATPELNQV